jgi:hypothetical protein
MPCCICRRLEEVSVTDVVWNVVRSDMHAISVCAPQVSLLPCFVLV